jgi:hypothetical protein
MSGMIVLMKISMNIMLFYVTLFITPYRIFRIANYSNYSRNNKRMQVIDRLVLLCVKSDTVAGSEHPYIFE